MKAFFMAVIFVMIIKGVWYILAANLTKRMALILINTSEAQIVAYGWILVIVAFITWISYVRFLEY